MINLMHFQDEMFHLIFFLTGGTQEQIFKNTNIINFIFINYIEIMNYLIKYLMLKY